MWKKSLLLILSMLLILTLAACDKEPADPTPPTTDDGGNGDGDGNGSPLKPPSVTTTASGTLKDGAIAWTVYSDGRLEVTGTGAMPDFSAENQQPWYPNGGMTTLERDPHDEGFVTLVTKLVIGEGITKISENAFRHMQKLEEVQLPSTVTEISYYAFYECKRLETVTGGTGVTTICDEAFRHCTSLSVLELSGALTEIGYGAFDNMGVSQTLTIRFTGTEAQWQAVEIANGNAIIKDRATLEYKN